MASTSTPYIGQKLQFFLSQRHSATAALQSLFTLPIQVVQSCDSSFPDNQLLTCLCLSPTNKPSIIVRHVHLQCHGLVLSEAWNAYVPSRLTHAARHNLKNPHIPFGRALGEHTFWREGLKSCTDHLPSGFILENHAILHRHGDNAPFSVVIERYTSNAFPTR